MIRYKKATLADVAAVLNNCSEITAQEMEEIGISGWKMLALLRKNGLDHAEAAFDGRGPLYIFNHSRTRISTVRSTTFLATKRYFDLGPRGVFVARQHLANITRDWPGVIFESRTLSRHKDVARWFKALGFSPMPGVSNPSLFVYQNSQKCRVTEPH
ncbi:hypothetical protein [Rhodoligotrophos defluvii]|uniref:hypothetical protein n=1 Tax=Rhodoligotrophos defluvii TaxID=2561934 RepID=UPI0010C9F503|nr:hypothetical protein [Rhodoligotrophos defluvii]